MSAEGKKKRGIAGLAKAQSSLFRLNGWAPDWDARARGVYRGGGSASSGSTTMRGMLGGVLAERMGYRMGGDYDRMLAHAQMRCTDPLFADDEQMPIAAE